jgi:hypothetical protein
MVSVTVRGSGRGTWPPLRVGGSSPRAAPQSVVASSLRRAASMCASNSSRNFDHRAIGIAIASPSTHRQLPMMFSGRRP